MLPCKALIWQLIVVVSVGTSAGCRIAQCPPPEATASVIAVQTVAESALVVRGRVLSLDTGELLPSAQARVVDTGAPSGDVTAAGALVVRVGGPGSYTIEVTAPGYDLASRVVVIRPDSGAVWTAVMARTRLPRRARSCGELTDSAADRS